MFTGCSLFAAAAAKVNRIPVGVALEMRVGLVAFKVRLVGSAFKMWLLWGSVKMWLLWNSCKMWLDVHS